MHVSFSVNSLSFNMQFLFLFFIFFSRVPQKSGVRSKNKTATVTNYKSDLVWNNSALHIEVGKNMSCGCLQLIISPGLR